MPWDLIFSRAAESDITEDARRQVGTSTTRAVLSSPILARDFCFSLTEVPHLRREWKWLAAGACSLDWTQAAE